MFRQKHWEARNFISLLDKVKLELTFVLANIVYALFDVFITEDEGMIEPRWFMAVIVSQNELGI